MNLATFIEKLTEVQQTVAQLLAQLQTSEDRQVRGAPLPSTKAVSTSLRAAQQGNKAIEREVIASFQAAESLGFMGDFRQWEEHLLRIHE
jgi:hypothetical protein